MISKIIYKYYSWKLDKDFIKFKKQLELQNKMKQEECDHDFKDKGSYKYADVHTYTCEYGVKHVVECVKCNKRVESVSKSYLKTLMKN